MFRFASAVCLGAALLFGAGSALGQQVKVVYYFMHDEAGNPDSPVTMKLKITLQQSEVSGSTVGWKVLTAEFKKLSTQGATVGLWLAGQPAGGDLWYVTHADPQSPLNEEFVVLPHLEGTADAQMSGIPDLEFNLTGAAYSPPEPPAMPPFGTTGILNRWFRNDGASAPFDESGDEPVDVPPNDPPPDY